MNHNTSRLLMYISWFVGVAPVSIGIGLKMWWLVAVAGSVLVAGYVQACIFCRCPKCHGNMISKVLGQTHCPYCGEPID